MKRYTSRYLGFAILAGTGIGIAAGCLIFNENLRHQLGRKMRKLSRACRNQSAELRDTASEFLERRGRDLKGARETGRRVYHRLAG
jgi:phosphate/sulfate permease